MSTKNIHLFLILFFTVGTLFSQTQLSHKSAWSYLQERGEVYFTFKKPSPTKLANLAELLSIDKIVNEQVYAYANRQTFTTFESQQIIYTVLIPPGLAAKGIVMSDYSGKGPYNWDTYPTYSGYLNLMKKFEEDYPQFVKIYNLGKSVRGRDILIAKVSDNVNRKESEPEWLLCGGIHGDETAGIVWMLRLIEHLCTEHNNDKRVKTMLDSMETWIAPMINPDATYRGGNNSISGAKRTNANGADLNRNYTRLPGVGSSQRPEPETKIMMAFGKKHNFVMNIDWHGGIECAIYPYNSKARRTPDHVWWKYVCRKYADIAQRNGPNGFFDDIDDGICHGYSDLGYVSKGTTKDYFYYYMHTRGIALEATKTKLLPARQLNNYWNYSKDALFAYLLEIRNGIRGTVTDSITGAGLRAKVFVKNHDEDSSFIYADSSGGHGNYYRPIYAGTYDVTFSHPGCTTKTIKNIVARNGQATVVDVKLYCGGSVDIQGSSTASTRAITFLPKNQGALFISDRFIAPFECTIFNCQGKKIYHSLNQHKNETNRFFWNGITTNAKSVLSGLYIARFSFSSGAETLPFVYSP